MESEAGDLFVDVFAQFISDDEQDNNDEEGENMAISMSHLPAVLGALGVEDYYMGANSNPAHLAAIKKGLDPAGEGRIGFQAYTEVIPFVVEQAEGSEVSHPSSNVEKSTYEDFLLFTQGEDRPIELRDLQRISREMKDNAPNDLLMDMLQLHQEGSGTVGNKISLKDFEYIMKMAKSV